MAKKPVRTTNQGPGTNKGTAGSSPKSIPESQGGKLSSASNSNSGLEKGETKMKRPPLFEMKPYMRTPKLLLNNYCQKEKRPKPVYNKLAARNGMFRYAVIMNDPKGNEDDSMRFETKESFANSDLAQHYAAMLALRHLDGSRPLHKLFPPPLSEAWQSMDTKSPLVSRANEFISQRERAISESEWIKKQAEKKNKIVISEQKQKFEIPTLSMSYNIRKRTMEIVAKRYPMLTKSYSFKSWLFDNCEAFSGLPRSTSRPKLVSLSLNLMSEQARERYSGLLRSCEPGTKTFLLSLKYWVGIDCKDKEGIVRLIESCGFDSERSETALNVVIKETEECKRLVHDFYSLREGVYLDHFRNSGICIVTDIEMSSYPKRYVAWLCIMWLSVHLKENDLPPLITPKRTQIEVKDFSGSRDSASRREPDLGLIGEEIKSVLASSPENNPKPDGFAEEGRVLSRDARKPPKADPVFKAPRHGHLSASRNADVIISKLRSCQILVVKGETGCGKTTQIPILVHEGLTQFSDGMIYCSEPRRLAAVSVSARVRSEAMKVNSALRKDLIGHSVRLDHNVTCNTRLVYCTHGILINIIRSELMGASGTCAPNGQQRGIPMNSVLILDEAHERSLDVDLLLYFMKQLAYQMPDIRIVIMSASIEVSEFVNYFNKTLNYGMTGLDSNADQTRRQGGSSPERITFVVDTISLPGRTPFPISVRYLPTGQKAYTRNSSQKLSGGQDSSYLECNICKPLDIPKLKDQVLNIIRSLGSEEGSVLIFLGGIADVNKLAKLLSQDFEDEGDRLDCVGRTELAMPLHVLPCHSNISYNDQLEIFKPVKGKRKVIVSTNIAEVSLTIEDIRFVIDTGRVRISIYDPIRHVTSLQEVFISRSSAQQRMGRAGRTAPGKCFRIFTEEELQSQPLEITPEILRLPIEHIILDILCYLGGVGSEKQSGPGTGRGLKDSFRLIQLIHSLQDFFTPPKLSSIETSLLELRNCGALDDHFEITPLGELLSRWPVDLSIGILFLYGLVFNCIDPIVTIASFLTCEIPWKLEERRLPRSSTNCDYMIFIKVYNFYLEHFKSVPRHKIRDATQILQSIEDHQLPFDPKCLDISKMETIYQTKKHLLRVLSIQDSAERLNEAQIFSKWNLIQTCLSASLYPNIACIRLPKRIKYVESGSGLFAETIQFNKLFLFRKNRLSKKSIGHFFHSHPNDKPITVSRAHESFKDSEDVSRVFLSESSAIYNRMYDLGTYHCIMYMSLFESFAQNKTVLRFPISTSMYSLLLFASESLQLNPFSLINQMKKASSPNSSSASLSRERRQEGSDDQEGLLNHILIDDWIFLQCPGKIQSLVWYFRHVVREFIQFLSQKLLESKFAVSPGKVRPKTLSFHFSMREVNEILELLHFLI